MAFTAGDLVAALDLAPDGEDRFTGRSPADGWRRIFGGLVVAQALVAMQRTVPARPAHSLHGYFMLPGDPGEPVGYAVERLRDGGSFSTRRCVASQRGRPIFVVSASFHVDEGGTLEHAEAMPVMPDPDTLPAVGDPAAGPLPGALRAWFARDQSIEVRAADRDGFDPSVAGRPRPARQAVWMRVTTALPVDPALHRAMLAYMSDLTLLDTALVPHGRSVFDADIQAASLDHALWFHRPVRADDWLLYVEDSPSASGARGFARGTVFDRSGRLIASTAQEGLVRRRR